MTTRFLKGKQHFNQYDNDVDGDERPHDHHHHHYGTTTANTTNSNDTTTTFMEMGDPRPLKQSRNKKG